MTEDSILPPIILTVNGKTYDVTSFKHPGGMPALVRHSGKDISELFVRVHKMDFPEEQMAPYLIDPNKPATPFENN
jgi:cytochrome b involved in lipid metabolism